MSETPKEDHYEQYARALEEDLQEKLKRSLDAHERNSLRNAGSGMMLETLDRMLFYAKPGDDLEGKLKEALSAFDSRLDHFISNIDKNFVSMIGRSPTEAELAEVRLRSNLFDALRFVDSCKT